MVLLIIIPTKWLFHWGYTPFSDIPNWSIHDFWPRNANQDGDVGPWKTSWENFYETTTAYIAGLGCFSQGTDPPVSRFVHWEKVNRIFKRWIFFPSTCDNHILLVKSPSLLVKSGWVVNQKGAKTDQSLQSNHSLWMVRLHELRICMKTYHFLDKFWPVFAFFSILQGIRIIIRPHKTMQTTKMN